MVIRPQKFAFNVENTVIVMFSLIIAFLSFLQNNEFFFKSFIRFIVYREIYGMILKISEFLEFYLL